MQRRISRIQNLLFVAIVLMLSGVSTCLASHHEKDKTSAAEVKTEAAETYETLKQYTLEQRDQAMAAAKDKLAGLDDRIAELQNNLDKQWQNMSEATRQNTRAALDSLQQQREEVAKWYDGMRHSSAEAWEDVKKGFADSYDRLKNAFMRTRKDFEDK